MKYDEIKVNSLMTELFYTILKIEQNELRKGEFSDLSITEIHTLEAIGSEPNRTMTEVAAGLGITLGTLTTAVNRLIKKGYARRGRIKEDKRVVIAELTEKGERAVALHNKFHIDMVRAAASGLDDAQKEVLMSVLDRLKAFFVRMNNMSSV
ncbi:MAG: MarR family winged helix-turn-helix transcriptional regulator [Christensenellales bacterium]|jgi:DNA-binding MarR family transcriptional regulator